MEQNSFTKDSKEWNKVKPAAQSVTSRKSNINGRTPLILKVAISLYFYTCCNGGKPN